MEIINLEKYNQENEESRASIGNWIGVPSRFEIPDELWVSTDTYRFKLVEIKEDR